MQPLNAMHGTHHSKYVRFEQKLVTWCQTYLCCDEIVERAAVVWGRQPCLAQQLPSGQHNVLAQLNARL